jgi:gas vesicle protein
MKQFVFFLLGAAIGAVTALVFAPASGAELRAQLRAAGERDLERLQADSQKGLQKTSKKLDALQADLKQALHRPQHATEETV